MRKRRKSEDFLKGYLLATAHASIILESQGWGRKKRLPEFGDKMIDLLDDWQNGNRGYKESVAKLQELTGMKIC